MSIKLKGSTSGSVELDVPAAVTGGDVNLTLPGAGTVDRLERAGNLLQVKETYLDTPFSFSYTLNTDTDVTNLSVSLTPTTTTSKVLIFVRINHELNVVNNYGIAFNLKRDGTFVGRPDAVASGLRTTGLQGVSQGYYAGDAASTIDSSHYHFLDSPGTIASVTYQVSIISTAGSIMYVNRTVSDTNNNIHERFTSSIVAMEIAA